MRRLRWIAVVALSGCSAASGGGYATLETPPEPPPMVETTGDGYTFRLSRDQNIAVATIDGRRADVFRALLRAYEDLGIDIGGADDARGMVQSEEIAAVRQFAGERLSTLFHCGQTLTGDRADSWRLRIEVASQAQPLGERTQLTTRLTATARTMDGSSTNEVACSTRGALEQKIAATTARHLGPAR